MADIFVNLHQHSFYSKLDAVASPEELVDHAKKTNGKAVALTEHGTLASTYRLWKYANSVGITPILGLEAYYVDDYDSPDFEIPYNYSHLILLCKNETGWNNLKKLQSIAWEQGYNRKPCVSYDALRSHYDGLVASSACLGGVIGSLVMGYDKAHGEKSLKQRKKMARRRLRKLLDVFGDDFYLEVQFNDAKGYDVLNKEVIKLAEQYGVKIIPTNDVHYVKRRDWELHDVMKCVGFGKTLDNPEGATYDTHQLYCVGFDGLVALAERSHPYITYEQIQEWSANTVSIADQIERYPIRPNSRSLPSVAKKPDERLRKLTYRGFKDKIVNGKSKYYKGFKKQDLRRYKKRIEYELKIIADLGFSDYYLMVIDIVNRARELKIPFNMRGSVCGSLAAFCCGITWIDSIRFDCPFERFLTEDRISMPDMDMDFSQIRRTEMIDYVREKYGEECVAHIESFAVWKPKGAIKDTSRVLGINYQETNEVTKQIDDGTNSWEEAMQVPAVAEFVEKYPEIEKFSKRLMGVVHATGIHASGVILTPEPIDTWIPVAYMTQKGTDSKNKERVTEWDMYAIEALDILKLDFLGLKNLDIVAECVEHVINRYSDMPFSDLDTLYEHVLDNLDDKDVYEMCATEGLVGTFQMGTSEGMKKLIHDMKADCIDDIIASISLYRTAVLRAGMHDEYVNRKFGGYYKAIHPKLEEVLKDTYGVLIYQESVMSAAVILAGFTPTESDHFRKGIKLKDAEKFAKWKEKFVSGCKEYSDIEEQKAKEIWQFLEYFSGYGFNKCLAPDNTVEREDGEIILLEEVKIGDMIKAYEGDEFCYDRVEEVIDSGEQEVFEVSFDNGSMITCTLEHKFLCEDGEMHSFRHIFENDLKVVCEQ